MPDSDLPQIQEDQLSAADVAAADFGAKKRRSALFIVFLVVFIDLLGFGIVLPLLPFYADDLLKPLFPGEEREGLRGATLGLLMASFSMMQFIFAPIWGRISDRIGRRPILLLGLGASVVFYALFGIASELGALQHYELAVVLLFVARIGAGIAGATISTAQAVIADSTPPDKRARGMALIGAAFGIGFTFGPLVGLGSLFIPFEGTPGFLAAALSLTALILGYKLLPETLKEGSQAAHRRWLHWQGLQNTLRTPSVGLLVVIFFLATFAFGGLESTLALINKLLLNPSADPHVELSKEALRSTGQKSFLVFAYVGLVLMIAQGFVYRRWVNKVGEVKFLRAGALLMTFGLASSAGLAWAVAGRHTEEGVTIWLMALPVLTVAVTGFALLTPSVQSLISRRSDPAKQGEVLGVNQSASALARILGPMLGPSLFYLRPKYVLPYLGGTALLVIVYWLTLRIRPGQPASEPSPRPAARG